MVILAFECANFSFSGALLNEDQLYLRHFPDQDRGQDAELLPMLQSLLGDAGIGFQDLDRIVTTLGPGSFTGLRTGLAAAKGLEMALPNVEVKGIDCITLTAQAWIKERAGREHFLVALESRRAEPFVQHFDAKAQPLSQPELGTQEMLKTLLQQGLHYVVGDAAAKVAELVDVGHRVVDPFKFHAGHLAQLAANDETWKLFDDLSPRYLREAEVNLKGV